MGLTHQVCSFHVVPESIGVAVKRHVNAILDVRKGHICENETIMHRTDDIIFTLNTPMNTVQVIVVYKTSYRITLLY